MSCHHGVMAHLGNLWRRSNRNCDAAVGRSDAAAAPLAWSPPATVAESMDRSYAAHRAARNRRGKRTNGTWPGPGPGDMSKQEWLRFADRLHRCADDAGIIATEALPAVCDGEPWAQRTKELARLAGWVEVLGVLVRGGATKGVVKAAVKHLGGRATVVEVAAVTGKTETQVSAAFSACDSLIRVAPRTWAVAPDGYLEFCDALCWHAPNESGRVAVLDEARLLADLKADDWDDHLESVAAAAGCVRVFGVLVRDGSPASRVAAALVRLGRPATSKEIAGYLDWSVTADWVDEFCRGHSGVFAPLWGLRDGAASPAGQICAAGDVEPPVPQVSVQDATLGPSALL